jgi:hypothetical protein
MPSCSVPYMFPPKNKDNLLNSVCHQESPSLPDSLFEPVIKG